MPSASVNLKVLPYRLMRKTEAAHYCAMSPREFERSCPVRPLDMGGKERRWDVHDLDRWIDGKKGAVDDADDFVSRLG